MALNLPILFNLVSIAFLCLQTQALPFLQDLSTKNPTTINANVGSSGIIDIKQDSQGFYVETDLYSYSFTQETREKSNVAIDDTVKMMISLSNSESMVALSCLDFTYYDCVKHDCCSGGQQADISYPRFTASARFGEGPIYLDKNYWMLTLNDNLYLAKSCQTGVNTSFIGLNRYGVLGLGTNNGGSQVSQKFSIFIKPDLNSGKLIFTDDKSSYTNSSDPLYTLPANSSWQLTIPRGYLEVTNYAVAFDNGNIIFDVNTVNIGLPYDLFKLFISYFVQIRHGMWCSSVLFEPYCYYPGTVQNLPDIFLSFNNTKIRIPPKIYASPDDPDDWNSTFFYLNLKATGSSLSGVNYVSPAFKDSIILGANFMSYYFTVFDATSGDNVIEIYPAVTGNGPESNPTQWIVIGVVVVIFLAIIYYCAKRNTASGNKNATTIATNITQEPLVYNYAAYQRQQGAAQ